MVKMAKEIYLVGELSHNFEGNFDLEKELISDLNVGAISLEAPKDSEKFVGEYKKLSKEKGVDLILTDSKELLLLQGLITARVESIRNKMKQFFPGTKEYKELDRELSDLLMRVNDKDNELLRQRNEYIFSLIKDYLESKGVDSIVHIGGLGHLPHLKKLFEGDGFKVKTYVVSKYGIVDLERNNIVYTEGDLLSSNVDLIAHGVAEGRIEDMGTGIAKQIKQKFPGSFKRFDEFRRSNKFKGGDIWVDEYSIPAIAYIATQPNLEYADIDYLRKGLKNLRKFIRDNYVPSVGLPKIGCGYGKLDWEDVKPLIESNLSGLDALVLVYV